MPDFYNEQDLQKIQKLELDILKDFINVCQKHNLTYFLIGGSALGAVRHKGFIPWDDDIDVGLPRKDYEKFLSIAKTELTDKYHILNAENYTDYPLLTTQLALKDTKFVIQNFKNLHIPFGIYLDIFPFDGMCDDFKKSKKHARKTWFYGKLLILSCIPKPYVAFKGIKRQCIWICTSAIHYTLKILHISSNKLYKKCKNISMKYNTDHNKCVDYFCDTNYMWCMIKTKELYPLKQLKFEDIEVNVPNNVEAHLSRCYGDYMALPPVEKRKNHYPFILDFGNYN